MNQMNKVNPKRANLSQTGPINSTQMINPPSQAQLESNQIVSVLDHL